MASQISQRRAAKYGKEWDGTVQFGDWKEPKMEHAKFMAKLLQSTCPVICCCRAKQKSHQVVGTNEMVQNGIIKQNQVGRSVIIKDQTCEPVQAEDFIFEMTAHMEIVEGHAIRLTKWSHPGLKACFKDMIPITLETGQKLEAWCNAGAIPTDTASQPTQPTIEPSNLLKTAQKRLWSLCKPFGKTPEDVEPQLMSFKIIDKPLGKLSLDEVNSAIEKIQIQLAEAQ